MTPTSATETPPEAQPPQPSQPSPSSLRQPAAPPTVRHGRVLAVTCLALATVVSAMSSLNVALPSIAADTHASQTRLSWIIDAYSLVFAALLLPAGALGDRFGRRRALLAGLVVFGAASAVAPFTGSAATLIGLRAVLGLGAAFVMPATLSTITGTFPRERRAAAVGVWTAVAGSSAILGVLASGLLLEKWSWRAVFVLGVALAAVSVAGTWRFVPDTADPNSPPIDVVGAVIAVAGLGALVYSIIEAPENGWLSAVTLGGLGVGVVLLVGFVAWELRTASPLLDPRLFTRPAFAAGSLSIALQFFAFFGLIFVIMQYLQLVRGDSPLIAAVSMLPLTAGIMPSSRLAPRLVAAVGSRICCVSGLVLVTAGMVVLSRLDDGSSYLVVAFGLFPLGFGMGLAMTPATTAITDSLPARMQGVGSAVNDLSRELGGALGIAVLGSLLGSAYRSHLTLPDAVPPALADRARSSFGLAAHLGEPIRTHAQTAFVDGLGIALLGGAAVTALAALAVTVLLRAPRRP
ncbi:Major Facilitator Superfamily transporter [Frankia canadensis]|uniref:Major Facilitator Superfamily transporter n=1 Tax=Frankia canadensis TaxID=1836972 RepID=A0A2I2KJB9_9ACTN|nr:MFS transporter [Frankia canadensis]SNQ45750.1 Major Facilitator Superfamily transporter [Frankia canadensis]SOU53040.1 Major Facilitator Superfamily transporter [Frankia canadensis]